MLAQKNQQWRLKKVFQTSNKASVLSSLLFPHFCKSAFFLFCLRWQKAKRINKKTEGPVQLLFCLVSVSHFKMVLFTKKKQFVCWEVNEKYKEKKSFSFVHKTTFWLLVRKNKSKCWTSVVLRLVLKERQRQNKHFVVFFLLALLWCPNKKKEVFFEVVFCS